MKGSYGSICPGNARSSSSRFMKCQVRSDLCPLNDSCGKDFLRLHGKPYVIAQMYVDFMNCDTKWELNELEVIFPISTLAYEGAPGV